MAARIKEKFKVKPEISLSMEKNLANTFKIYCFDNGIKISKLVREWIIEFLIKHKVIAKNEYK